MSAPENFQHLQQALASHLREPKLHPAPAGVDEKRVMVYQRLFFNNIAGFIGRAFPVLRKLYRDDSWQKLIRHFYAHHHCHTPYFRYIPQEFVDYLGKERTQQEEDPPYLYELAHYEWVELSLSIAKKPPQEQAVDADGDLLQGQPVLTAVLRCLSYHWPVHKIRPDFQPQQIDGKNYHYIVYRDHDHRVRFLCIQPIGKQLLESIQQHPHWQGHQHIENALQQCGFSTTAGDGSELIEKGRQLLNRLREKGVVLGTLRAG